MSVDYGTNGNGSLDRALKPSSQFWIDLADSGVVPYVAIPSAASLCGASSLALGLGLVAVLLR